MRLQVSFFIIAVCINKITSQESEPAKLDRLRYQRSRARPKGKPLDPIANNEGTLDFVAVANAYGYEAEEHTVVTQDGYKLRTHRITGKTSKSQPNRKPVVYVHHGFLTASDSWIIMGPNHDLGYMLSDAGFDVWFGNSRGNTYSRNHVRLDPDRDRKFWDFSLHEIGIYDLPADIDYILKKTNEEKLVYIGHSMGAAVSYVLLSQKPEYNNKIQLVISLSPSVYWHSGSNVFTNLFAGTLPMTRLYLEATHKDELFPLTEDIAETERILCGNSSPLRNMCGIFQGFMVGYNPEQLNKSLIAHSYRCLPAGTSAKFFYHFMQMVQSGRFEMYDYGLVQNLLIYNQMDPFLYNVKNVVAPAAIFYGEGDSMIPAKDVVLFSRQLPNAVIVEPVPLKKFNHLDFLFARDLKTLLNDRLVALCLQAIKNR